MHVFFTLKQRLRSMLARLWPVAFLVILALFLLQPQTGLQNRIHTSSLGRAVFGFVNGNHLPAVRDALYGTMTIALWLLLLLVAFRGVLGLLASDKQFVQRMRRWLQKRPDALDIRDHAALPKLSNFFSHEAQPTYILRYTLRSLEFIDPEARISLIDEGYVREGWRPRLSQRTAVAIRVPVSLPHVHIISRANRPDQTSILKRLRDTSQYFQLEGDFSKIFDVYAARQFELYALTILDPHVMHQLMERCPNIDIELDQGFVRLSRPGYVTTPQEAQTFEAQVRACYDILKPYITKQVRLAASRKELTHHYELRDPTIRPVRMIFDSLLAWVVLGYFVLLAVILVSSALPLSETINVLHGLLKVKSPWFDMLEALSYMLIAFAAVTFIASEIEVAVRRLQWQRRYKAATSYQ